MTRAYFDQELQKLQDDLIVFSSMVSEAVLDAVKAMRERDVVKAQKIVGYDRTLNERRFGIEDRCLTLLATQQPTARDLRLIAGVMEINIELERMGDYAKGISRIILMLGPECTLRIPVEIQQMADTGVDMLRRALGCLCQPRLGCRQGDSARRRHDGRHVQSGEPRTDHPCHGAPLA